MTSVAEEPLAGYRVGVTAERRRDEMATLLRRRGAQVSIASAIHLIPLVDDDQLRAATLECIAAPCDDIVVTTGIGFRGWMEAADAWGLGDGLRDRLLGARILSRGPKATGAIRSSGLQEAWTAPSESTDELVDHMLAGGVRGRRVALQLHGLPVEAICARLEEAGAEVMQVPVYRWDFPTDLAPLDRLLFEIAQRKLDAVTFTSALAVSAVLTRAIDLGIEGGVTRALRASRPWACCVGPVTAAELVARGIPVITPARARLGDLLRTISVELPNRLDEPVQAGATTLRMRRDGVVVDGEFVALPETPMAILRELALHRNEVVGRQRLLDLLPDAANANALETSIARLRAKLPVKGVIETVIKRGYRLAHG